MSLKQIGINGRKKLLLHKMISLIEFFCNHEESWVPTDLPGTDRYVCVKGCGHERYVYNDHEGG